MIVKSSPQLLSTEDVSGAEEGNAGESQVLVQHEHTYWDEVGVTQVVNEAADVAIVPGVNTVHLPILYRKEREMSCNVMDCLTSGLACFTICY